ncbi:MAG: nitrous oxide reductase accessory protein NosL [Campylobacterota bacterium]|nr:nitrous oxide reductase accessory protein NosL [Campylobacterota bacterium]
MKSNTLFKLLLLSFVLTTSLLSSSQMTQALKEKKIYPMGEKIYNSKCKNVEITSYKTYDSLLNAIEKESLCGSLNEKHSEALSLYIWDVKKAPKTKYEKLTVTKKDKCQVCGMHTHHYPTWVTRIKYPKGETYNFDGAKCMFKFYFNNVEGITEVLVQDYYTLETLEARDSYFVVGSDVYGPMGHELIAFKDEKSAKTFSLEHKGKEVLFFDEITEYMVRSLGR